MNMNDFFKWSGILTSAVASMMRKTRDGVFTLGEAVDVAQDTLVMALDDAIPDDFKRFGAITDAFEYDDFDYQDGDILVVIPHEIANKLKLEFNK